MRISLKLKLILSYICVILVSFGLLAFFLDRSLEEESLRSIQSTLITQARLIENQVNPAFLSKGGAASLDALVRNIRPKTASRITIINKEGKVLADSDQPREDIAEMESHFNRPEVSRALSGDIGIDTRHSSTLKIDMLYVAIPIKEEDETAGVLRLALPLDSVEAALFETRRIILLGLFFAVALAFVLGFLIAARLINPVNRMIQVSRKYAEGDFSRRIIQVSHDELGELAATLNRMAQDIEDKIREIRTQNQQLTAIFESMIEGVIMVDKAGCVLSVNPAVERIFGVPRKEAQGKFFLEAIRNHEISDVISGVLRGKEALSGEVSLVLPVRKIFQFNAVPIFDGDSVNGCLVVIHDITQVRRLETMRRDFVANVSHELKTPLTSIKGFVETLLEGALDDKKNNRNFLKIIQEHAERLNGLVNDLLSLSYLESKGIELKNEVFNLRGHAEEIIQGFKSQLKKKDIEIKDDLSPDISLKADEDKIGQVFTNLIDNAIKFNREKGSIRISASEVDGKIKIIVEDSGMGIPEKDLPRIFERFYRVDKARSRELGGTGLGLAIVKHIVELHGGSVGVVSIEGQGSRFWFTLPK